MLERLRLVAARLVDLIRGLMEVAIGECRGVDIDIGERPIDQPPRALDTAPPLRKRRRTAQDVRPFGGVAVGDLQSDGWGTGVSVRVGLGGRLILQKKKI